jgi:hypothetical protein
MSHYESVTFVMLCVSTNRAVLTLTIIAPNDCTMINNELERVGKEVIAVYHPYSSLD